MLTDDGESWSLFAVFLKFTTFAVFIYLFKTLSVCILTLPEG